ncbi:MAG: maltooligosyl trehalose synthase [Frankiales bacterium]|nr:maltooligosyl trehalose synthase [Frankiales bacterium]
MQPPSSTYRLQITADFPLISAAELVDYLVALGVGAVYVSPLLRATAGSNHGYDVVDHTEVDPDRGGPVGLAALAQACRQANLGLVVDIVPNHMGVEDAAQNRQWWELLRDGPQSPAARWFDVDWAAGGGKILLPVLGSDDDADTALRVAEGELHYYEHRFPLAAGTEHGTATQVHARQHYRLVGYRHADTDQNYRRFFAVTTLAGIRVEDPAVFDRSHAEILRWVHELGVTGIRIDHPDGLSAPGDYLRALAMAAPNTWITVEKITEPGEELPPDWPVAGMTGYDALAEVNNVLIDPGAEKGMTQLYAELTGDERNFTEHVADGKRLVATTILQAELRRLARLAPDVSDATAALTELAVAFDVYRSYLPRGREHLTEAVALASERRPDLTAAINQLVPRLGDPADELASRFQQATGAIMAKGVEDTAYYRYNRLISLNEVGGFPGIFGSGLSDFHEAQLRRIESAPRGMTTLSTHDTKRGEDIRARIAVLAEIPDEWYLVVSELLEQDGIPNRAFGYLLWQTFAATGLVERDRLHAYAEKAMREAADGTGWTDPDEAFEATVHAAVDAAYDDHRTRALVNGIHRRLMPYGESNSLAAKLVQLTMPGVPDVYQGSELWEDSLVDPDNRRLVDFGRRRALLAELAAGSELERTGEAAKLWLVRQALWARRYRGELFAGYTPLLAEGPGQNYAIAFDRGGAITLATRLPVRLESIGGWQDTTIELPTGEYRDTLTGRLVTGQVRLADVLADLPVALLLREAAS